MKRVRRLDTHDLRSIITQSLSDVGQVTTFADGLVVVTDTVEILTRVAELLDQVEAAEAVTWVVQLHVVQLSTRDIRDLGLDVVPALEVGATLGDASSRKLLSLETDLTASLKGVLQFVNEKGNGGIVAEPMFLLVDGEEGTMNRTRRVPIEQSVVNPQSGTISRSYTFQEVGLQFRVKLRELNWQAARASIFVSLGDIESQGTDGRPPITKQQELAISADMRAGGVYLVGALRDGAMEKAQKGGLKFGGLDRGESAETLVFARVARVGSPLVNGGAGEGAAAGAPATSGVADEPDRPKAERIRAALRTGSGRSFTTVLAGDTVRSAEHLLSFPQATCLIKYDALGLKMLEAIHFKNFKGFGDEYVKIDLTQKVNVIIGPNDSGKSTILGILHRLAGKGFGPLSPTERHQHDGPERPTYLVQLNWANSNDPRAIKTPRRNAKIEFESYQDGGIISTPFTDLGRGYLDEYASWIGHKQLHPSANEEATRRHVQSLTVAFIEYMSPLGRLKRLPTFRQLNAGPHDNSAINVAETLANWKDPDINLHKDKIKFNAVQSFMRQLLEMPEAEIEVPRAQQRILISNQNLRLPIEDHGTGISQLLYFAVYVLEHEDCIFTVEEPETNLHPRLQKAMLQFLINNTKNRYLITTHSPSFLSLPDRCGIIRVSREDGRSRASKVATTAEGVSLLRDLGVAASDLLQSRFAIWIEGPSDAIYLRKWITLAQNQLGHRQRLVEGVDFSFIFYGGSCLYHLSFDRDAEESDEAEMTEAERLISALRINQNAAIIIDSDLKSTDGTLRKAKKRIIEECSSQSVMCWVTSGREIENYLPANSIEKAFNNEGAQVEGLKIDTFDKIESSIKNASSAPEWKAKWNYAKSKPSWATKIVGHIEKLDQLDLASRLTELIGRIDSAR